MSGYGTKGQACRNKIPFATRGDAETRARRVEERTGTDEIRTYRCRHCGKWHLGRPNRKYEARRR